MNFSVEKSIEILQRTPDVLEAMLRGISTKWSACNEGAETWSAFDILGHLIHGERTDWIPRMGVILSDKADKTFDSFDRLAQFKESQGKSLGQLLDEFKKLRRRNVEYLRSKHLTAQDLERKGVHPAFGEVTLSQLLSTWVVHDLDHISQISRVMAKQYSADVGPWMEYLRVLRG